MGEGFETYPVRLCVVASDVYVLFARDLTAQTCRLHPCDEWPSEGAPRIFT